MRTAGRGPGRRGSGTGRTVGQEATAVDSPDTGDARSRLEAATTALGDRPALAPDEARAVLARAGTGGSVAASLAADRAEAVAQLEAARAMLAPYQPPELEAPAPETQASPAPDAAGEPPAVAVEALRAAAREVLTARAEAAEAETAAAAIAAAGGDVFERARRAHAECAEAREAVAPAWRRTAGALISGSGIGILVAALAWPAWVFLLPAVLVLIMAFDLRIAAAAARTASVRSAEAMAAAGVAGPEGLDRAQSRHRERLAVATRQRDEARARQAEAEARWRRLAPDVAPDDVEALIARFAAEAPPAPPSAHGRPTATPPPVAPSEPPDPDAEKHRALAERLAEEARQDIERIDRILQELADADHARRSLEWHEAQAAAGTSDR